MLKRNIPVANSKVAFVMAGVVSLLWKPPTQKAALIEGAFACARISGSAPVFQNGIGKPTLTHILLLAAQA